MAAAAVIQAILAVAIWLATRAQASVAAQIYCLQKSIEEAHSRVELIPVIELPTGQDPGIPVLSVGNASANGCRLYEVELTMERTASGKKHARQMPPQYCAIPGTGIVPGFGEIRINLAKPVRAVVYGLLKGPDNTAYPEVKMWATIRFLAGNQEGETKSKGYTAQWIYDTQMQPTGQIRWLKPEDE